MFVPTSSNAKNGLRLCFLSIFVLQMIVYLREAANPPRTLCFSFEMLETRGMWGQCSDDLNAIEPKFMIEYILR